jgi:hypothetical protein
VPGGLLAFGDDNLLAGCVFTSPGSAEALAEQIGPGVTAVQVDQDGLREVLTAWSASGIKVVRCNVPATTKLRCLAAGPLLLVDDGLGVGDWQAATASMVTALSPSSPASQAKPDTPHRLRCVQRAAAG